MAIAIKTSKFQIELNDVIIDLDFNKLENLINNKETTEFEKNSVKTNQNKKIEQNKILSKDSEIILSLIIFDKIKIYKKDITKIKLKDFGKKIDLKLINKRDKFNINFRNLINDLEMEIEKLDLKIQIGTENAMITAFSVAGISSFLAILLREQIKDKNKQKYIIVPRYTDENILKIEITGIFHIDLLHYINRITSVPKSRSEVAS